MSTFAVTGTPHRWQWLRAKLGFAFGAAWLIYLSYPFSTAWAAPAGVGRDISLVAVLLFSAVYLLALAGLPQRRLAPVRGVWTQATWLLLSAELILVVAMSVAAHEAALAALVFVTVTAVFLLPSRQSLVVVTVLIITAEVVPRLVPGWQALDGLGVQCALLAMAIKGYVVLLARNAELLQARQELSDMAVGRERERMARDVHDILGHSLTVITVKSELASKLFAAGALERAGLEIADVESLSRAALADVRATVSGLREVGLATELASARSALRAAGIEPGLPSAIAEVPERLRDLFAWAVREGTTNVIQHSGADTCEITLTSRAVRVCDDGRGPGWSDAAPTGHGLVGLRERAAALGASVIVGRAPNGGFMLSVLAGEVA